MALPPLPEVFGNYAVQNLEGLIAPDSVSWLPTTGGWKLLGAIALLAFVRWLHRRWRQWLVNRYRAEALRQLDTIVRNPEPDDEAILARAQQINRLLKAVALQAFPRREVAALSGAQWCNWLQHSSPVTPFSENSLEFLAQGQYRQQCVMSVDGLHDFAGESARWIEQHGAHHV